MDRGVTRSTRDLEKAKAKMEKCEDEAYKADGAYRNAVKLLEERRKDWERETELACTEFQEKDEEQTHFFRAQMWATMNALSQVALDVDQGCERVRAVLELCDVDEETQRFINHYTTGTQRPAPIFYQNYHDNNSTTPTTSTSGSNVKPSRGPPPLATRRLSSTSSSSSPTSAKSSGEGIFGTEPPYEDPDDLS
ncbi:hypothetical protein ACOMHN_038172 [Nucella lapillus]